MVDSINSYRQLKDSDPKKAAPYKRKLPVFIYQATFTESLSKKGIRGNWRKQANAVLNGLFILDIDHVAKPREVFCKWVDDYFRQLQKPKPDYGEANEAFCDSKGILLVHITPSGEGLRLVAMADPEVGNIADNQHHLAKQLGVEIDESCKDASRLSFCPILDDIIYINKNDLFTYNNEEFNQKFGDEYRKGHSSPNRRSVNSSAVGVVPAGDGGESAQESASDSVGVDSGSAGSMGNLYRGVSYEKIIKTWFEVVKGGQPHVGDRHQSLYQLACDLRYITDNDRTLLERLLSECPIGEEISRERGVDEIRSIADNACQKTRYWNLPRRLQKVLEDAGVPHDTLDKGGDAVSSDVRPDYGLWWSRLRPLLATSPGYREAVATLPDHHKLGGVLAAGAMFGTYLTRTWWEHFDGKTYRPSFLVYIIGDAASGKSFVVDMDKLIMQPMRSADDIGREWERKYKEEMKKRSVMSKSNKSDAPEQQHPVIRYLPSTISNAMLYRRLSDAIDKSVNDAYGNPTHLHCYTCEAELSTALRAQQGSWAGKLDLECKSFQNEMAGVDYANDQSSNGIIEINWNQVVSGTPDAMRRKIKPSTVLDGLVTRLVLFPVPSNDYAMIERQKIMVDRERAEYLKSIGSRLECVHGCLDLEKLVDYCYEYERKLTEDAALEQDRCLDYFRKRIPLIMIRYTLVRVVLRQLDAAIEGKPLRIDDSDLEFARLIGDFVLEMQMRMYGQDVIDALDAQMRAFVPRKRTKKTIKLYNSLPNEFTREEVIARGISSEYYRKLISRWVDDNIIMHKNNKNIKLKPSIE